MAWIKFGLGGLGVLLIGVAGLMALNTHAVVASPLALGLVALSLAALAFFRLAPDRFKAVVQSSSAVSSLKDRLGMRPAETAVDGICEEGISRPGQSASAAVSLIPMMPSTGKGQTNSWIGGAPVLPEGAKWPEIDGKPAQFLAQIDCRNLPVEIWGGAGPRTGHLAFFRAAQTSAGSWPVEVLHVDGPLTVQNPPKDSALRPRWPLKVAPLDGDAEEFVVAEDASEASPDPDWVSLHNVDLTNPAYQPFDWLSAQILLNCMRTLVQGCAARMGSHTSSEEKECLKTTALQLAELTEVLMATKSDVAFSSELCQMLMDGLAGMTLPDCVAREESVRGKMKPLSRHQGLAGIYFAPFERHCRVVFASDPQSLPCEQRNLFEPFWEHNARHETGCMGAEGRERFAGSDAINAILLMELPSSELLGWKFGDARAFRVFITPDALARGDLGSVWANVVG